MTQAVLTFFKTLAVWELLRSKKGFMCLLVLGLATWLCRAGHVDGTAYAAVCGVVYSFYSFTAAKVDVASMERQRIEKA